MSHALRKWFTAAAAQPVAGSTHALACHKHFAVAMVATAKSSEMPAFNCWLNCNALELPCAMMAATHLCVRTQHAHVRDFCCWAAVQYLFDVASESPGCTDDWAYSAPTWALLLLAPVLHGCQSGIFHFITASYIKVISFIHSILHLCFHYLRKSRGPARRHKPFLAWSCTSVGF